MGEGTSTGVRMTRHMNSVATCLALKPIFQGYPQKKRSCPLSNLVPLRKKFAHKYRTRGAASKRGAKIFRKLSKTYTDLATCTLRPRPKDTAERRVRQTPSGKQTRDVQ